MMIHLDEEMAGLLERLELYTLSVLLGRKVIGLKLVMTRSRSHQQGVWVFEPIDMLMVAVAVKLLF